PADAKLFPQQGLGGRRSERHDQPRLYRGYLGFQPRQAGGDLVGVRFLVNAAFASRLRFEVLDDVGDVRVAAFDARPQKRFIEHRPGGTDKRLPGEVLVVAGLFTNQQDFNWRPPFAENRLRRVFPQRTGFAARRRVAQNSQGWVGWNQGSGSIDFLFASYGSPSY